jgi:hypothetical protein
VLHAKHKEDNPNLSSTPDTRAGLATAQQTLQTVLLIVVTFVGTWLGIYRVPWQVSGDPCLLAAGISVIVVTLLWLTRWWGSPGAKLERILLAGFLVIMPLVYVTRYLFAFRRGAANHWLWIELAGAVVFVALAVLGVRRSPWFLASGMVLHGLAWDSWHYRNSTYIPDWYVIACMAVDLAVGVYVAARVPAYQAAWAVP